MTTMSGDRSKYWPLIEKRYGQKMEYWFGQMEKVAGKKYPEQIAFLREGFGFSQAHANALVMYTRGSATSARFATLAAYLAGLDEVKKRTVRAILDAARSAKPGLELVMAWNKPMLKSGNDYVLGVSAAKDHVLLLPFRAGVVDRLAPQLRAYKVNKKTIEVPPDWKPDAALLGGLVKACLYAIEAEKRPGRARNRAT